MVRDTFELECHYDVSIPTDAGTVSATRYEPVRKGEQLPALLMLTPYHKDDYITFGTYEPLIRYLAKHGYEVVTADMIGTGGSTGTAPDPFDPVEGDHAAAIVRWLAEQDWSTGRVGMFGTSWGGITALEAAAVDPDPLDAIVPIHAPYTAYRNGYINDGLFEWLLIGGSWLGARMPMLHAKPRTYRDADGRWADVWRDHLEDLRDRDPWLFQFMDHEWKDEYWRDKDIPVGEITTPTLAVSGWRDGYLRETIDYYGQLDGPKRLLLGPWRHINPHKGRETAIDFRRQAVAWFDRFLRDEEMSALNWPEITYWTERDGGGKIGQGVWRGTNAWPDIDSNDPETVSFGLTGTGIEPLDEFDSGRVERVYEHDHTVGMESMDFKWHGIPLDTNADDARSLTFESQSLDRSLEFTGTGKAVLRLSSTVDDPIVVVRLVDIDPDGRARLVTRGMVRPTSLDNFPNELAPDEEYRIPIRLKPKSHLFEAGHRMRIAISASYFPVVMPASQTGTFTVTSSPDSPSTVFLPSGERDPDTFESISMRPPDRSIPTQPQAITDHDSTWTTARERSEDVATVITRHGHKLDLPYAGFEYEEEVEARVQANDPGAATLDTDAAYTLEYDTDTVKIEANAHVARSHTQLTVRALINGKETFEETWVRDME